MSEFNINEENNNSDEIAESTGEILTEPSEAPKTPQKKVLKEIIDFADILIVALCFVILIFSLGFKVCTVEGDSMINTLHEGENLIVSNWFYTPKRGDIIVFHDTNTMNEAIVKRVIATEGETVNIYYNTDRTMTVEVIDKNNKKHILDEKSYINYDYYDHRAYPSFASYDVPEGTVFVMGDNRYNSKDSRDPNIGFVDTRTILGKAVFRFFPLSKLGFVNN